MSVDQAVKLNQRILLDTTEKHFVLNLAALEAGIDRPRNQFHYANLTSLPHLATHLIYGVGKAHGFEQGNKRTAWGLGRYFLRLNGYTLQYSGKYGGPAVSERVQLLFAKLVEALLSEDRSFEDVATFIARCMVRLD
ncbi:type II toxin-antitoxin system death-on-curing family toxin [Ensifer sp. NBAIM29]|nr:type II toxin-antitoxin system death-on-curing family toxin [Ensifer sp. NBAIM29]